MSEHKSTPEPNTKHVPVPMAVPRDPERYRATTHFGQRLKSRVPQHLRDRVVRECIERGECYGTIPTQDVNTDDVRMTFAFEREIDGRDWRVVVGCRDVAFLDSSKKHLAMTVMEVHDDD